jgi:hypothetical protein
VSSSSLEAVFGLVRGDRERGRHARDVERRACDLRQFDGLEEPDQDSRIGASCALHSIP